MHNKAVKPWFLWAFYKSHLKLKENAFISCFCVKLKQFMSFLVVTIELHMNRLSLRFFF